MNLSERIKGMAGEEATWCKEIRRHLHAHPELSFQEKETSAYIRRQLTEIGCNDVSSIASTGLTCSIIGTQPGKTVLLRADIDALPIQEQSAASYCSTHSNVMHACGHDAHTAMLLLAAKVLQQLRNDLHGTIKILFQPAEETIPGGAIKAIDEGILRSPAPHAVIGQHVMPRIPFGKVGIRAGKFMASSDHLIITIQGKGGHAAMPELLIDPIPIAANIIVSLQQVVSRQAGPKTPTVLSIGKITAAGSYNVVPDQVVLEGTFRTLDERWRKEAHEKIEKLVTKIAASMGAKCEIEIVKGYPYLHNNEQLAARLKQRMAEYVGSMAVEEEAFWMASEDFAYYTQQAPAVFYLLGVGSPENGIVSGLHTPTFDIDERALSLGGGLMAWLAVSELSD